MKDSTHKRDSPKWGVRGGKTIRPYVMVWEAAYGPVPSHHVLHHINGDREDNRLENLICLTQRNHMRLHQGAVLMVGGWYKECRKHGLLPLTLDYWPMRKNGKTNFGNRCKECRAEYRRQIGEIKGLFRRDKTKRTSDAGDRDE